MSDINRAQISGRLGRDPECRYTPNGQAVTQFSVASDRSWKDSNNEWQKSTFWSDVVVFGKSAERAAEQLRRGGSVYAEGYLQTRSWEKDGQKHYKTELVANVVLPIAAATKEGAAGATGQSPAAVTYDDGGLPF